MAKNDSDFVSVIKIFFNGIKLYFMNFEQFFKVMAFPVFGQVIGISLIFFASYLFTVYAPTLTTKSPLFDNIPLVFAVLAVLMLPGFFIFCKAFWDYIIALASLNSMASSLLEGSNIDDTGIHSELIKRRTGSYILFLFLLTIIYLVLAIPILWGLLAIAFVYLALSFQVFALEEDKGAFDIIKYSVNYVKFNFIKTAMLLVLLGITTYWLVPALVSWGFEQSSLIGFFASVIDNYVKLLPINEINSIISQWPFHYSLKSISVSRHIVLAVVAYIVTAFALPLRSICCTQLYKEINKKNYAGKIAAEKLAQRAKKPKLRKNVEDEEE